MFSFQKYKKLKQIEVIEGSPGTFSQDQIPGFRMCQNGIRAIETEADIAEHVFGRHELKKVKVFFASAFEDVSFQSFLKVSD